MSQAGQYNLVLSSAIETITGDSGGAVGPMGGNVDLVGDGTIITVVGTPASSILTITPSDTLATTYDADVGSATPASNTLTIAGGNNIATDGAGSTITVNFDGTLPVSSGGTGATTLTDHGVLLGSGTSAVTVTGVGTDGQVLIGATGADPAFASLTSSGSTIDFTPGANTLNLETGTAVATSFPTDGGTATPSSGALTVAGGTNIDTSGSGSTVTIDFTGTLGLSWSVIGSATKTVVVNEGYFSNYAGTLAFTLPSTAAVGDTMEIAQMASGQGWSLAQNAGQTCYIGNTNTTTGAGGSLASTDDGDWIEIICRVADTDFQVNVKSGNITVV